MRAINAPNDLRDVEFLFELACYADSFFCLGHLNEVMDDLQHHSFTEFVHKLLNCWFLDAKLDGHNCIRHTRPVCTEQWQLAFWAVPVHNGHFLRLAGLLPSSLIICWRACMSCESCLSNPCPHFLPLVFASDPHPACSSRPSLQQGGCKVQQQIGSLHGTCL